MPRVAYLSSQYPTLSMSFVLREVKGLRERGWTIETASINSPDRPAGQMTADEAAELPTTFYIKQQGLLRACMAHITTALSQPRGYGKGLAQAIRLAGMDARRLAYNFFYLTEALLLGRWMKERDLHHLHVHLGQQSATVGMLLKTVHNIGLSITIHGPDEFYDARGQYLTEKIAAADFLVAISHFAQSQLMFLSPPSNWHKIHLCRLGVDPQRFSAFTNIEHSTQRFEILCVGRLVAAKGQRVLVEAVRLLAAEGRSLRLRLIGSGPDEPMLRAAASNAPAGVVELLGPVNQDQIRALYAEADLFAILSFAEGIPVVLMEAMAMQIPCLSTHITGIPELITSGQNGWLVAPSDLESTCHALRTLMDQPDLRHTLAAAGRERILAEYDLGRNLDALSEILTRNIVTNRR